MTAATILDRLDGVRPTGDGRWIARCPAHDDRSPSLSIREAERRLNIGQRRVQRAFDALLARGWIAVHEPGGFTRKMRHATAYRLENEPGATPGAKPAKPYMRWQPRTSDEK